MRPIVAFLQNPWFKPGTSPRSIKLFQENQEFRQRVICLSRTGKLLHAAFGDELYSHIWWDEANMTPCFTSSGVSLPDVPYMARVLATQKPEIILTFGWHAHQGLLKAIAPSFPNYSPTIFPCNHPTARGKHRPDLLTFANTVRRAVTRAAAMNVFA